MPEDKTFKSHEIDVAGLFGDKDTGAVANHILSKMKKLDAEGAISGAGSLIIAEFINMLRQEKLLTSISNEQKAGRQRMYMNLQSIFMRIVISSWDT